MPAALRDDPSYVKARGVLDGVENFDAAFFGISPREAEVTDPQHRVFLEIAWECLERAGHAPDRIEQLVGVFAGVYTPSYLEHHVLAHPEAMERIGEFQVMVWQRQGLRRHPRGAQIEPARAGGGRAHGLLHLAGGHRPGGGQPAPGAL